MNSNGQGLGNTEEVKADTSAAEPVQPEPVETAAGVEAPVEAVEAVEAEAPTATVETPTEASSEESAAAEGDWLAQDTSDQKQLKRGDVLEGTVTATSPTSVQVDVGAKTEGIIPGRELERMNRETIDLLKPGAVVSVYVVNPHDHNGDIILSLNRALEELDWRRAEEYRESQEVYESHVAGYNKGGLIVRFGRLRGFVPQSQISPDRRRVLDGETPEERWGKMVNEIITVKVMEVDRARNRLILSERMASRESRESRKESLIGRLQVGEVRTGRVVSLVDFGAFVDVGGAEGLVHLTELSWKHVTHPKELLEVGQEVKVEVISIDPENKRIGLSMKRQEADPWDTVAINFQVGQLVQGIVTKMTKFGAFVRLVDVPEIEGLVHISELSDQRVVHPRDVLQEGETVTLRVVKMDIGDRRLGLSLKRVNSAEYLDMDWG
ncbi:MAG: S1 RNA-binding domain-containing protein [Anaerolineae bacterium]|nr:S1 RNA-binding domain-containing protein [Anaerolineae bacterium]MBN8620445.1 S1 RNA-binding domain-containing protein [Anaerolineae bacterium]